MPSAQEFHQRAPCAVDARHLAARLREEGGQVADRDLVPLPAFLGGLVPVHEVGMGLPSVAALGTPAISLPSALQAYEASWYVRERLAASDPANAGWQRDLWVSCWRIAEMMERTQPGEAREWWQRAYDRLMGMKRSGMFVSAQDEGFIEQIRRKIET